MLHAGSFDALIHVDGGTLKTVHPLPEFATVSHMIDEALYGKLVKCVAAVQDEKKRRVRRRDAATAGLALQSQSVSDSRVLRARPWDVPQGVKAWERVN